MTDDVFSLDDKMTDFVQLMEDCLKEIDRAAKFTRNIVRRLNPKAGTIDKMVAFPISQHCETSYESMKKVFTEMGEVFRMFSVADDGITIRHPNAKRRKMNLHLDGLSARNFRKLPFNLTSKLTETGSSKYVMAMIISLTQITVQNDYFHETRMHRQDCIWRSKYGCFLQALQVLLGWKRINGDPVKSRMQEHELFLYIVEKALRCLRFQRFIDHSEATVLSNKQDESAKYHLLRLDEDFSTFCNDAEMSNDEPS